MKVYKITGQQMFVVIDDIDLIKVTSESVHIYSIKKKVWVMKFRIWIS